VVRDAHCPPPQYAPELILQLMHAEPASPHWSLAKVIRDLGSTSPCGSHDSPFSAYRSSCQPHSITTPVQTNAAKRDRVRFRPHDRPSVAAPPRNCSSCNCSMTWCVRLCHGAGTIYTAEFQQCDSGAYRSFTSALNRGFHVCRPHVH
jgi:hypothetical protein